eukprot:Rhum_TRINITY_DN10987_c0_g1::Rhum_TRINITY_DN10987_c0_g1_i1::g.41230::m.41230
MGRGRRQGASYLPCSSMVWGNEGESDGTKKNTIKKTTKTNPERKATIRPIPPYTTEKRSCGTQSPLAPTNPLVFFFLFPSYSVFVSSFFFFLLLHFRLHSSFFFFPLRLLAFYPHTPTTRLPYSISHLLFLSQHTCASPSREEHTHTHEEKNLKKNTKKPHKRILMFTFLLPSLSSTCPQPHPSLPTSQHACKTLPPVESACLFLFVSAARLRCRGHSSLSFAECLLSYAVFYFALFYFILFFSLFFHFSPDIFVYLSNMCCFPLFEKKKTPKKINIFKNEPKTILNNFRPSPFILSFRSLKKKRETNKQTNKQTNK